jgi:hypothetical protein
MDSNKKELEDTIIHYTTSYLYKYIKLLGINNTDDLLKISTWNSKKKSKEFSKFDSWVSNKYNLDYSFTTYIHEYIYYIILLQFNKKIAFNYVKDLDILQVSTNFFYKSLRRIAKFYFEQRSQELKKNDLQIIIESTLDSLVPLYNIIDLIKKAHDDSDNSSFISYQFSEVSDKSSNDNHNTHQVSPVSVSDTTVILPYIDNVSSIDSTPLPKINFDSNIKKIKFNNCK